MSAQKRPPKREGTGRRPAARDCDPEAVLDALNDPDSQAILECSDTPMTVTELAEACDIPSSTAYRKVDKLEDVGLLERTVRLSTTGRHPDQYERSIEDISIDVGSGITVDCR